MRRFSHTASGVESAIEIPVQVPLFLTQRLPAVTLEPERGLSKNQVSVRFFSNAEVTPG